ncbi:Cof-like hydrolase [Caldicellulosiruptor obsidiansis OB47]|uniref:Cof-like hydrolase n=1 Tax=Caldicellulosiruptor obsidiansis (strain ATCC BAA-2073 / JCM 16842 / OB47) TaxID=608506 RepID=D9TG65_CALOO|nr:Cof-type HAD-IIB family hydrolase [Caldicellulosiruptor obsidiansis]ADL43185.1 Cof-like hydrolase [Caldicellulosiruptor obsidiansis OB47]
MYKLIAIDLDMTLLDRNKNISYRNKKAIELAKQKGVKIVLCSGRILKGVMYFAKVLGLHDQVIVACNGAIVRDLKKNKDIYYVGLENEKSLEIARICKENDIYYHYYFQDTMIARRLDYSSKFYYEKNKELPKEERIDIIIDDSEQTLKSCGDLITKFVIIDKDVEKVDRVREIIEKRLSGVETTKSDTNILEVMKEGVNKKRALEFVCSYLGIDPKEIMAIGDNENDLQMIEFAGLGVAMENAIEELKKIADFVTQSYEDDGVAKAIEKFVLGEAINV